MGWPLLAVISAIAAGITSVFAKAGLEDVPSHLGNAVRTGIVLALSIGVLVRVADLGVPAVGKQGVIDE